MHAATCYIDVTRRVPVRWSSEPFDSVSVGPGDSSEKTSCSSPRNPNDVEVPFSSRGCDFVKVTCHIRTALVGVNPGGGKDIGHEGGSGVVAVDLKGPVSPCTVRQALRLSPSMTYAKRRFWDQAVLLGGANII